MKNNGNPTENTTLIFLHIPKAAGSTLSGVLMDQYHRKNSYRLDGKQPQKAVKRFKQLPEQQRARIKLLRGHLSFGLHMFIPGDSVYFTMLRQPVERIISHYYYVLQRRNHHLHQTVTSQNISLKDYVAKRLSPQLSDGMVKMISGKGYLVKDNVCPPEMLEHALENLDRYFFLPGLTERFDETLLLLKDRFNWPAPVYLKRRVTAARPGQEELDKETLDVIRQHNRLDIKLYEHAATLFDKKITSLGEEFQTRLKAFRLLNGHWKIYGRAFQYHALRIRFRTAFLPGTIRDVISRCESLINQGQKETAEWFLRYALELYPGNRKLQDRLTNPRT